MTKHQFSWVLGVTWALAGAFLFVRFGHDAAPIDQAARFWLCFSLGIGFYVYRDAIPLTTVGVIAFGIGFWLSVGSGLERVVTLVATGYAVVWFAKIPTGRLRHLTNKIDLSYGIYIFGWPITQTLILLYTLPRCHLAHHTFPGPGSNHRSSFLAMDRATGPALTACGDGVA